MALSIPPFTTNEGSPVVHFGQITDLLLADLGNPLSALTQTALDVRTDNTTVVGTEIRMIPVIGDKPAPESNAVDISHHRKYKTPRKHVINFKIDETDDVNYTFMNKMIEDGVTKVLAWYIVDSSKFYGGKDGIEVSIALDHVIPESGDELETIIGTLEWTSNTYPARADYPLPTA